MLSWLCIFHFVQCTTQGIKAPSENTVMGLAHWSLVPPCQFFLSLLLSFSGWSLGAQRCSAFTYLPGLLRPEQEGALRLHSLGRSGGCLWPTWTKHVPCLGALLAFCVNQGISASILSSIIHSFHSFIHQRRPSWGYPRTLLRLDPSSPVVSGLLPSWLRW